MKELYYRILFKMYPQIMFPVEIQEEVEETKPVKKDWAHQEASNIIGAFENAILSLLRQHNG